MKMEDVERLQAILSAEPTARQVGSVIDELEKMMRACSILNPAVRAGLSRVYLDLQQRLTERLFAAIEACTGRPCPLTQADVTDSFIEQFFVGPDCGIEIRYEQFVRSLMAKRAVHREGTRFIIVERFYFGPLDRTLPVWSNQHFSLSLMGSMSNKGHGFDAGVT